MKGWHRAQAALARQATVALRSRSERFSAMLRDRRSPRTGSVCVKESKVSRLSV